MSKKSYVIYEHDPDAPLTASQAAQLDLVEAMPDEQIDTSDIRPLSEDFWRNAKPNPFYRPAKRQLTIRLDADVLKWLQSMGKG